ncbi:hypothetical protein [Streptomyces iconiensis]|uniref:Uncharacterized protein n=1 Tax=Streptomyces iconiensis TaxID=1384038 RepID=A0ABT6ZPP6_9ACTN|nr:hypothetical protein [Streptomyces iconiensis]MDJ1131025.1 hypothetical protein [Streptomyces iconiensis]
MSVSAKLAAALSDLDAPAAEEAGVPRCGTCYEAVPRCACHTTASTASVPRCSCYAAVENGS